MAGPSLPVGVKASLIALSVVHLERHERADRLRNQQFGGSAKPAEKLFNLGLAPYPVTNRRLSAHSIV
jgi:hypothetical protein